MPKLKEVKAKLHRNFSGQIKSATVSQASSGKYERQLVKLQRQLSHKEKRSKNYNKTKKKIAICHEKIRNTRKDYLHKVSHEISAKTK